MRCSTIAGIGGSLPPKAFGNDHFAGYLDTSDEWIVTRTGIRSRRFADKDTLASELALPAARAALSAAGMEASEVGLIIFATTTPDRFMPSTACLLQAMLGMSGCAAFDVQAVCSGFVYGLDLADALIRSNKRDNVLVVGADLYSRVLDYSDRSTCILFGDGAGAAVLRPSERPGIAATNLYADGGNADVITTSGRLSDNAIRGDGHFRMDGPKVYRLAVKAMEESARQACADANVSLSDIAWFVPHQANLRIMDTLCDRLGIEHGRAVRTVESHANTSAASIPLALDTVWTSIKKGDWVLMTAAGGGFTWGSVLWQA